MTRPTDQPSTAAPAPTPAAPQPLPNPLRPLHADRPEVDFQPYADVEIVSTFGEPQAEYAATRKSCGMMDLPQRGILELTGKDRLPFLNNLLTHGLWDKATKSGLPPGEGRYAFFLNTKGRVVADMNVLERGDRTLLEMDGRMVATVRAAFDRFLFAEQVMMSDRTPSLHQIGLHGPKAKQVLDGVADVAVPDLPLLGSASTRVIGHDVTVWRDDPTGAPGYYLIVPTEAAAAVWNHLLTSFGQSQELGKRLLRPIGWAVFNTTRVESGRPLFGIDFDDSVLPAETGLFERAVSVTKGCYLGQEIVARMYARAQVARRIVGLRLETDALPIAGAKVFDDKGNEIGGVTSSTISPILSNAAICLAYAKKPFFTAGTQVTVPAEGEMRKATVVATPFVGQLPQD